MDERDADRVLPGAAGELQGAPGRRVPGRNPQEPARERSCASTSSRCASREDAPDRQLRLVHLQPLPAAGGGERRGADRGPQRRRDVGGAGRREFDNVVVSPGPGRPDREADFGVCADAISEAEVPLLGVCLGHQGLGCTSAARRSCTRPRSMHGRLSAVYHDDSPLFAGIPQGFQVVRYHSLCVRSRCRTSSGTAWTSDGVLMGWPTARGRSGACSSTPSRSAPSGAASCSRTSAT